MIHISNIEKFCSVIDNFEKSGIQVKLFGYKREDFFGAHAAFNTPANNSLLIRILAMTSVGSIYCDQVFKLSDAEAVEKANSLFDSLDIMDAELSYDKQSGILSVE